MKKLFISYSHGGQDRQAFIRGLAEDIESLGCTVWFDEQLTGGQTWWTRILGAIRDTDVLVLALSPDTLKSTACQREYGYAISLGKPLLPVLVSGDLDRTLLPAELAALQYVDYRRQDRAALRLLARALNALPAAGPLPDPLPVAPPAPGPAAEVAGGRSPGTARDRRLPVLLLVGLGLVLAVAGWFFRAGPDPVPQPPPQAESRGSSGPETDAPPEDTPPPASGLLAAAHADGRDYFVADEVSLAAFDKPHQPQDATLPRGANRYAGPNLRFALLGILPSGTALTRLADYSASEVDTIVGETQGIAWSKVLDPQSGAVSYVQSQAFLADDDAADATGTRGFSGELLRDCPDCPEMVLVPAGRALVGATDAVLTQVDEWAQRSYTSAEPAHYVAFPRPFAMARYELTYADYNRCVLAGACPAFEKPADESLQHPLSIDAYDTQEFVETQIAAYTDWLSRETGARYRLPLEAEWEYAAKAGTSTLFWFGDAFDAELAYGVAVPDGESQAYWIPDYRIAVQATRANPWQLHGILGNVGEITVNCSLERWHVQGHEYSDRLQLQHPVRQAHANCPWYIVKGGDNSSVRFWLLSFSRWDPQHASMSYGMVRRAGVRLVRELDR